MWIFGGFKPSVTFGGIWSDWLDKSTGEFINSVSIMTQQANQLMEKIHNINKRQPIIIHKNNREKWFDSQLNYDKILDDSFNFILNSKIIDSPFKSK